MPRVLGLHLHDEPGVLSRLRTRASAKLWLGLIAACASSCLVLATIVWPDWIEIAIGVDPDQGNSLLEWLIVAATAAMTIASALVSRVEWLRIREAAA